VNFKALFIIPSQRKVYGMRLSPAYPPLGLLYISSVLEKLGVEVKILDYDVDKLNDSALLSSIKDFRPNIIGMTSTTPIINEAFRLADLIKSNFEINIILGGIHPTLVPDECISHHSVDFVVKGEAEDTIRDFILETVSGGKDFSNVKGLFYKQEGKFYFTGERNLIEDLDKIPFPARHLLNNFLGYKPPDAEHLPVASIMTTRGCPGRCTYCCTQNIFKDRYRMRGIENVLEEIDDIIKRFKVREIHIADDALNINKIRTMQLCEAIRKRNYNVAFEFLNGLRADLIDQDLLEAFKSIGIRNVGFGVESADKNILKRVKKNIPPEKVEDAVRLAKNNGFKTWVFFMIGLPGETEETIKNTIKFAKKLDADFTKFMIFKPYPGSEIYKEIKDKGYIDSFDFDKYGVYTPPVHHLESLSAADLLYWQKRAFREFYFRPKKIWAHIIRQKSLSQLKLSLRGFIFICFNIFRKQPPPGCKPQGI